jgi:hypothetical protein
MEVDGEVGRVGGTGTWLRRVRKGWEGPRVEVVVLEKGWAVVAVAVGGEAGRVSSRGGRGG